MKIRPAILAGQWYPAGEKECENEIRSFIREDGYTETNQGRSHIGGIVPHAGWFFSGAIACNTIRRIAERDKVDTVVLFGMHLPSSAKPYIMGEGGWETPFGPLSVDEEIASDLIPKFSFIRETPARFSQDNTIEVQLPFVQYFFKNPKILPIGAPPSQDAKDIANEVVSIAKEQDKTIRIIGSTDLTHYGPNYGFEPQGKGAQALEWVRGQNDREVITAMLEMNPEKVIQTALEKHNACCSGAAAAAIEAAKGLSADEAALLYYGTSYDKNPGSSFVGYAGILLSGPGA